MDSILKTRKTVKYYVLYNLISASLVFLIGVFYGLLSNQDIVYLINNERYSSQLLALLGTVMVIMVVFIGGLWLLYKILYGFFIKRLNDNYKNLKEIDSQSTEVLP